MGWACGALIAVVAAGLVAGSVPAGLASGGVLLAVGLVWVWNERRRAAAAGPTESPGHLSWLAQRTPNAVIITDPQRRTLWVNEGFTRISGYTVQEMFGRVPGQVLFSERTDRGTIEAMSERLSRGEGFQGELLNRAKDGRDYWVFVDMQPRYDHRGELVGFMAVETDVTEHKLAQVEHERVLAELAGFFESSTELLCITDLRGMVTKANDAWHEVLGSSSDSLLRRSVLSVVHPEDAEDTRRQLLSIPQAGAAATFTNRCRDTRGCWRRIEWRASRKGDLIYAAGRDVTEHEAAQNRLRVANEQMELALQAGRMGLWMWDLDTGAFTFDERWASMLGEQSCDLLQDAATLLTRVHPTDVIALETAIERHEPGQTAHVDVQYRVRHRDGSWRWVRLLGKSTRVMGSQQVHRLVGVQMDVHDQVEAQIERARREMVLANTVRITEIGGWEYEVATEKLYWSDQVCAIHEVPDDFVPTLERAVEFYQGDSRDKIAAAVKRGIEHGEPWDIEGRLLTVKGRRRWVRAVGEPVFEDGRVVRLVGAFQDVTEQRAQREALEASNRALEVAQSISRMGSWSHDARTDDVTWSRQLYELFEFDPQVDRPTCERSLACYTPEDAGRLRVAVHTAKARGTPYALTLERRSPTNGVRYVAVEGRARCDEEGRVMGLFGTARDVTAEVEREAELQQARERAEDASRIKTEFLANMSHEIRTPMTAILGYAELLDDPELPAEERSGHLDTIRRNGEHLLNIINDILDISKIESGRMGVERIETRPVEILRGVARLMQVNARARNLDFVIECQTAVPERVRTDPTRLRQILVNLIGNALKFTSEGGVRVSMGFERAPGGGRLRVDVQDTGIGMTPEQLGRIFTAFNQADASTTRRFGGTGLGLLISKRLAEMLGGDISVVSEPGLGSTFTMMIGVDRAPGDGMISPGPIDLGAVGSDRPAKSADPAGPLNDMEVLLIEDGIDNLRLIEMHLERAGARVTTARDGIQALEALTQGGDAKSPLRTPLPVDVILTDMQMPRMDGYTVARTLRDKGCDVPIIALTAHTMDGDRERCLQAGCDGYMEKPTNRHVLVAAIKNAMAARASSDAA